MCESLDGDAPSEALLRECVRVAHVARRSALARAAAVERGDVYDEAFESLRDAGVGGAGFDDGSSSARANVALGPAALALAQCPVAPPDAIGFADLIGARVTYDCELVAWASKVGLGDGGVSAPFAGVVSVGVAGADAARTAARRLAAERRRLYPAPGSSRVAAVIAHVGRIFAALCGRARRDTLAPSEILFSLAETDEGASLRACAHSRETMSSARLLTRPPTPPPLFRHIRRAACGGVSSCAKFRRWGILDGLRRDQWVGDERALGGACWHDPLYGLVARGSDSRSPSRVPPRRGPRRLVSLRTLRPAARRDDYDRA